MTNQYMRTQDDACYLEGGHITFENITTWNDANGASFVLGSNVIMRNSNSIYARSVYYWWTGGRVFSHRASPGVGMRRRDRISRIFPQGTLLNCGMPAGNPGFLTNVTNLAIENHKIQDPFPSLNGVGIHACGLHGDHEEHTGVCSPQASRSRRCLQGTTSLLGRMSPSPIFTSLLPPLLAPVVLPTDATASQHASSTHPFPMASRT